MVYYFTSNVIDPPATIYVGKDKFENEELIKFGWDCDIWVRTSVRLSPHQQREKEPQKKKKARRKQRSLKRKLLRQFHADNLSSAHIYLRLTPEQTWDALPKELVEECAQLTKANSIEGSPPPTFPPFPPPTPLPTLPLRVQNTWDEKKTPPRGAVAAEEADVAGMGFPGGKAGNKKDNVTIVYTPWTNLRKNAGMATGQVGFGDPKKTKKLLIPTRSNATINRLDKTRRVRPADDLFADKEAHLARQRATKRVENEQRKKEEEKVARERREEKERRERGYEDLMAEAGRSNEEGFDEDDFM
ncbi:MAG: hypothetical protein Q9161_008223 [Pseudevernia consocians]